MRILGIDPGYDRLGLAIVEKENGKETLVYSDCFETDSALSFHDRLQLVGVEVENVIASYTPEHFGIENVFFNTNQKTAMHVAEVRGALLYIAAQNDLEIFEYTPPQIKAAVAGTGRGTKKDVINMLHKLIDINKKIRHDDEYDAIAVALTPQRVLSLITRNTQIFLSLVHTSAFLFPIYTAHIHTLYPFAKSPLV